MLHRAAWLLALAILAAGLPAGCVTRRYVITSDPPGAMVYRDGQPIGATPVEEPFIYYGRYRFRLVKDGYEPLDVDPELCPPWYQWPGVEFFTENLVPCTFRDVQVLHFQLTPAQPVRPDDVRTRAEELRLRGQAIETPPEDNPPRRRPPAPVQQQQVAPVSAPSRPGGSTPPGP